MANWVADYLARTVGAEIVGRAKNALHVRAGDAIQAHILGSPIHYEDAPGIWLPIDDALVDLAGLYSFKGCPVTVTPDGLVTLVGTQYWQQTDNIGIFNQANRNFSPLLTLPSGSRDGNALVRTVPTWGEHRLYLTPRGLREELMMLRAPAGGTNDWLVIRSAIGGKTWGDGFVSDTVLSGNFYSPLPGGEDANRLPIPIRRYARVVGGVQYLYTGIKISDLQATAFPIVFDPDFTSGSGDGRVQGINATYATARSTSANYNVTGANRFIGQGNTGGNYFTHRLYFPFDTSSIGAGSTVTAVTLTLTALSVNTASSDFDINIQKQDWSAQDPLSDANREAAFDNNLSATIDQVWMTASAITTSTPTASPALDVTRVNITGTSYYSLISSRDVSGNAPTVDLGETADIVLSEHSAPTWRPILNVTYTAAGGVASILPILSDYYRRKKVQ